MPKQLLIKNACLATMNGAHNDYGLIAEGGLLIENGKIVWAGPSEAQPQIGDATELIDAQGRLITPGLIDCHTHIIHGGNRASEFEMRLGGASYAEISRAGGGIVSTVALTRGASVDALLEQALPRVKALIAEGVTTLEVKSGYGLDLDTELKMLRVARAIPAHVDVQVVTSFLGAHAVPAGVDTDHYIDNVCIPALKAAHAHGLVDAVDGFCEGIAFSANQIARVFDVARDLGLPVKLHAEQLSHTGGSILAARCDALSADHVEYATGMDARAMASSGTVAVLLPGAFYTLRETHKPPVEEFRRYGVPMALATDCNPGSSPMTSLLLAMNMGCTLFGLTPAEALCGVTANAARALGFADRGRIAPGLRADLAIWDVHEPAELAYHMGFNSLHKRIFGGVLCSLPRRST